MCCGGKGVCLCLSIGPLRGAPPTHYVGVPATDAQGLAQALAAALAAPGPTVIEATIDPAHCMETVFD